jgi:hypothetical protein
VVLINKLIFLARRSVMRAGSSSGNRGGIVITHREYVRDITPSQAFTKYDFPINPGLTITMPWVSQLCESYEEYQIKAMVFEYKSLCSDTVITAGSSLGMGSVIMATNYNPLNNPFVDKRTMENYEFATAKKPSVSNYHAINVSRSATPVAGPKWVRTGAVPAGSDVRLYDVGTFSIATQGQDPAAVGTLGELWIAYEIEFFKPKYTGSTGAQLLNDHYVLNNASTGGFIPAGPFGSAVVAGTKLLPNAIAQAGTYISGAGTNLNMINFNATHQGMTFMVVCMIKGGGVANCVAFVPGVFVNCLGTNTAFDQSLNYNRSTPGAGGAGNLMDSPYISQTFQILPAANGPWTVFFQLTAGGAVPTAPCWMDVWVMQINGTPQLGPF